MNFNRLKGALVERGKTYADCAKALGFSTTAFSNKMNGHARFNIEEANILSDYLELSNEERLRIFFDDKLEQKES